MPPLAFIAKWRDNTLTERAGAQAHFEDLYALLGVEPPRIEGEYQYERGLHPDMHSQLGDDYTCELRLQYAGRVPGGADFVTYWFEKARAQIEAGKAKRAGLLWALLSAPVQLLGQIKLPALTAFPWAATALTCSQYHWQRRDVLVAIS